MVDRKVNQTQKYDQATKSVQVDALALGADEGRD